jgi:hypothetical protein
MKREKSIGLWLLIASTLILAGEEPDRNGPQTADSTSQTLVQSVAPQTISLTPGGPGVTATMTGTGLGNIISVQVIQQGRTAEGFDITLAPSSASTRAFDIKAAGTAEPGEYQLRIILKAQKRDLPSSMASVIVKARDTRIRSVRKEKATAAGPPPKATSKPGQAAQSLLIPKDTRVIRSTGFHSIASSVFNGAYFNARSCGGRDSERKTTANVPNAYFKQESLDRMEYKFTDGEKDKSEGRRRYRIRRVEIRACVDSWNLEFHGASVEGGKLRVLFEFPKIQAIKTRAMQQDAEWGFFGDSWDWSDQDADNDIKDFRFSGGLEILLTPVVENGGLSYQLADMRWAFYEPLTGWVGPGHFCLPEVEEPKIIYYKDRVLEAIRQRVMAMFSDASVRARLSDALTQSVKSGDFAGRAIASVSGKDDIIEIIFQK